MKRYTVIVGETEVAHFDNENDATVAAIVIASEVLDEAEVRVCDHIGTLWSNSEC